MRRRNCRRNVLVVNGAEPPSDRRRCETGVVLLAQKFGHRHGISRWLMAIRGEAPLLEHRPVTAIGRIGAVRPAFVRQTAGRR